ILDAVVQVLKANPTLRLEVQGHTDSTGSALLNQRLGEQRAQAVAGYFTTHGIDASRLTAKGYGSAQPATTNDTADGRAQNRRVELKPLR
ncbi:MAG: OmpA family protein, partial [Deltaproteobacteria bacterium]|nr:OmpA family protein [Deltaproteobacteria bacterium]